MDAKQGIILVIFLMALAVETGKCRKTKYNNKNKMKAN